MGTVCQFTLYDEGSEEAAEKAFDELARIESVFSRNLEDSDVSRFNQLSEERGEGSFTYQLFDETAEVLSVALEYGYLSEGRYNPAVGPLVDLWGIGTEAAHVPTQAEIDRVLPLLDLSQLTLSGSELQAQAGMMIDLGSIAKGYAADRVRMILEEEGMERGIINLGGNVLVFGEKPDQSLWRIGIQNPQSDRGDYVGIVSLNEVSMVTSGNYERFFEVAGKRYHHILDGTTGFPVENELAACTIITARSLDADALSTTLYSMGLEKGMAYTESEEFFEALFVTKDNRVYVSSGLEENFKLTSEDFILSNL
ncbi:MAG: FAD:protein FMN transferase [Spirochaetales bacterium]|nr:FAD:protein FMN transferase [Spirochaetales bacterium]